MARQTVRFNANSTYQLVANGATSPIVLLNPEKKNTYIVIKAGATVPAAGYGNTFILKCVAGEQSTEINLSNGHSLFVRSVGVSNSTISVIR